MQGLRDLGNALVVALISVGLMFGALSISLVEFVPAAPTATNNLLPSPAPLTATSTLPPTLTPTLGLESPTPTITVTPPAFCLPPVGWTYQITIQVGDTLDSIAARYQTSKDELIRANCLLSEELIPGKKLYVPPAPTSTFAVCIPGKTGWSKSYIVQSGDTLYRIGYNHYTTLDMMRLVNCRSSETIYPGDRLWVPNVATRTPSPTALPGLTIIPNATEPLTATPIPSTVTSEPTATDTPGSTPEPPTPTWTATDTPEPSLTPSPTAFPTQ
jgi:LysM repeat protein